MNIKKSSLLFNQDWNIMKNIHHIIILISAICPQLVHASHVGMTKGSSSSRPPLSYSQHARIRMDERDRSNKDVQKAINSGITHLSKRNDKRLVYSDATSGTKVVIDPKKNKVITVIAKKPKFQEPWRPQEEPNYKLDTRLWQRYNGKAPEREF